MTLPFFTHLLLQLVWAVTHWFRRVWLLAVVLQFLNLSEQLVKHVFKALDVGDVCWHWNTIERMVRIVRNCLVFICKEMLKGKIRYIDYCWIIFWEVNLFAWSDFSLCRHRYIALKDILVFTLHLVEFECWVWWIILLFIYYKIFTEGKTFQCT